MSPGQGRRSSVSMLLRCSSIGRRDRSSQRITIGIRVCLPGFPCRVCPWSWASLVSDSERQPARYLRRNLAHPQPVGSLRHPIRLPILLRQRRLHPGLAPRHHRPLFLRLRLVRIRPRILLPHSRLRILCLSVGFPRLLATLQIAAQAVILSQSSQLALSISQGLVILRAAEPLMVGVVDRLHVLGIAHGLRVRGSQLRWLHPMRWAAASLAY